MIKVEDCPNHRVVMVSSELVWANDFAERYGRDPIQQKFVYKCRSCVYSHTQIVKLKSDGKEK